MFESTNSKCDRFKLGSSVLECKFYSIYLLDAKSTLTRDITDSALIIC